MITKRQYRVFGGCFFNEKILFVNLRILSINAALGSALAILSESIPKICEVSKLCDIYFGNVGAWRYLEMIDE